MSAQGKRVVFILASDKFRDEELLEPKKILEEGGVEVVVASSSLETATGMMGARYTPEILYTDINVDEFDAVVFIGGSGSSEYWDDPIAHELAREAAEKGKLLGAICIAPVTLARAGLLKGKRATCFSSTRDKVQAEGAKLSDSRVEIDGNIVTGEGPTAVGAFGKKILEILDNQ